VPEVVRDWSRAGVELARGGVDVIAAAGYGHRHQPRVRPRQDPQHRLGILRGHQAAAHGADDAGALTAWSALEHGVQAVLRRQRRPHAAAAQPHPDDAPVDGRAPLGEVVEVDRLVRAVEAADADVHDGGLQG
jgi:hypothetical protein